VNGQSSHEVDIAVLRDIELACYFGKNYHGAVGLLEELMKGLALRFLTKSNN